MRVYKVGSNPLLNPHAPHAPRKGQRGSERRSHGTHSVTDLKTLVETEDEEKVDLEAEVEVEVEAEAVGRFSQVHKRIDYLEVNRVENY